MEDSAACAASNSNELGTPAQQVFSAQAPRPTVVRGTGPAANELRGEFTHEDRQPSASVEEGSRAVGEGGMTSGPGQKDVSGRLHRHFFSATTGKPEMASVQGRDARRTIAAQPVSRLSGLLVLFAGRRTFRLGYPQGGSGCHDPQWRRRHLCQAIQIGGSETVGEHFGVPSGRGRE